MLVSKLCDFWPQAVSSRFSNNQNHYFIDFWLGSWRLRGRKNVSVGHETSIPSFEKVSASSFSSRGLFFSSIWTVRPRYARSDNCPISEKKSPLSEKEVGPWPFPLGDILVSGPTEHLFHAFFHAHKRGKAHFSALMSMEKLHVYHLGL